MKKLFLIFPIVLFFILITTTTSCTKIQGCTDASARNYDIAAEEDDGTCTYQGKAAFYLKQPTADLLFVIGVVSLSFYIDDEFFEWFLIDFGRTSNCSEEGSITIIRDLGNIKSKDYSYRVTNFEDGQTIWEGTVNILADECTALELNLDNFNF